jgi:hypothetical protein
MATVFTWEGKHVREQSKRRAFSNNKEEVLALLRKQNIPR